MRLLAILTGAASAPACLDAAVVASRSLGGASIEALHVVVDPEHLVVAPEEIDIQLLRERWEGTAQERAQAVRSAFLAWNAGAAEGTPPVRWKALVGAEAALLCEEAKAADVIILVLVREPNLDSADAFHAAIFRSGKPVLIVPPGWRGSERAAFAHIAVGLSDSEAARHAIEGAGPWLRHAHRVTGIRIGARDDAVRGLTRLLAEAGTEAALHVVAPDHANLGAQLVREAHGVGADLLVAGAYRYPAVVEWLLGGTTRHLLAAADMPVMLAH
ncbi:universal stress protein [Sphingopyxis sp. 550A]